MQNSRLRLARAGGPRPPRSPGPSLVAASSTQRRAARQPWPTLQRPASGIIWAEAPEGAGHMGGHSGRTEQSLPERWSVHEAQLTVCLARRTARCCWVQDGSGRRRLRNFPGARWVFMAARLAQGCLALLAGRAAARWQLPGYVL